MRALIFTFFLLLPSFHTLCLSPPGFFCAASGNATLPCPPGFFCPGSSSPPTPCTCPSACPPNSLLPADPWGLIWISSSLAGSGVSGTSDGVGTAASFSSIWGLGAVDNATGVAFVGDRLGHTVRAVTPAGVVSTIAGLANTAGFANGLGVAARFSGPGCTGFAPSARAVYLADAGNCRVRAINADSGVVTTFAGNGTCANVDGPALTAGFLSLTGLAVDDAGGAVYVSVGAPASAVRVIRGGGSPPLRAVPQVTRMASAPPPFSMCPGAWGWARTLMCTWVINKTIW